MKTASSSPSTRAAFTLIELLVVITIIIILAGLLFPAFTGVQESAKKLQAKNDGQAIINSVKNYMTDYGKMPVTDSQAGATPPSDTVYSNPGANTKYYNNQLLTILLGKPHDDTTAKFVMGGTSFKYNPRQTVYLEAKAVKDATAPKNGLNTKAGEENRWYDPWGTAYCVWLDANYNNAIDDFFTVYTVDTANPLPQTTVAVASFGKDLAPGKKTGGTAPNFTGDGKYTNSDDVISWR